MASLTNMTSLGTVRNETVNKDAQLFQMPMPGYDSRFLIALDLFGAQRTIRIDGTYIGNSVQIASFIAELDALINGNQTNRTYTSDVSGKSYSVVIQTIEFKRSEAEVNKVDYSIDMLECSAIT